MLIKDLHTIFFSGSPKMGKIKTAIDEIAKTDIPILIKGESGTGKELVAEAIHLNSRRHMNPFVKVNCAAIPKGLLESELLGFEKGAFTGAYLTKPGKFELANEGTILLNDIGEMDISVQAKLLQVLQDGTFSRLGGDEEISVDTRVISTTKDHIEASMMKGLFREDLYFRINVMSVTLPPLRDRKEQIPILSQYFLDHYKIRYGKAFSTLSPETIRIFQEYHWPGNIRELENLIKRILLLGEEKEVIQDLTHKDPINGIRHWFSEDDPSSIAEGENRLRLKEVGKRATEAAEKEIIQNTLQKTHWNRKEAAKLLRVSYKALLYKIQKYHLNGLN